MKLIIQIPCYNEADTIGLMLDDLPRSVKGFDCVEWLVIDDGSADATVDVARSHGVDHVVRHKKNLGLARAFVAGIEACLRLGADVIVNTDADNQYCAQDIPALVRPILEGNADIVIGARPISTIEHFSTIKKLLQLFGSWVVRTASRTHIPDAPSGFRAMSRDAAMQINVFSRYTYTLETIIQAGQKNMSIVSVPIRTNPCLRKSRLFKSIPSYVGRSMNTIVRIFAVYKPFRFFLFIGIALITAGSLLVLRFIYYVYLMQDGTRRIQSLILASILLGFGFQSILVAFLADLLSVNRRLMEDVQYRLKRRELDRFKATGSEGRHG